MDSENIRYLRAHEVLAKCTQYLGGGLFPKGKLSRISTNSRAREGQGGGAFALGGGGAFALGGGLSQRKMIQFLKL